MISRAEGCRARRAQTTRGLRRRQEQGEMRAERCATKVDLLRCDGSLSEQPSLVVALHSAAANVEWLQESARQSVAGSRPLVFAST